MSVQSSGGLVQGAGESDERRGESQNLDDFPRQQIVDHAGAVGNHPQTGNASVNMNMTVAEHEWLIEPTVEKDDSPSSINFRTLLLAAGIFLLAVLPRLFVLFFVTDIDNPGVGWYNDAFHHWQIGYLSNEIGFSQGFLRLWDFKGMEYFWGLLHPLILAALFTLTGSVDILIPRLLSTFAGAGAITAFYFLARRYFGGRVAGAAVVLAIVNPVAVFADTSGMQDQVAYLLMMAGLLLWPKNAWWAGAIWGVAGMARAEYWVFGMGLVFVSVITAEKSDRKIALAIGWLIPSLAYMRYLQVNTGNPIYPVYWSFFGNVVGSWTGEQPPPWEALSPTEETAKLIFMGVFVLSALAAIILIRRRPASLLFLMFGVGNIMFLGMYLGFTRAVGGWYDTAPYDRAFIIPYMFLALSIAYLVIGGRRDQRSSVGREVVGILALLALCGVIQLSWNPILDKYERYAPEWAQQKTLASQVASAHRGGTIAIPEGAIQLTYLLVREHGLEARDLIGEMYDPFYYLGPIDDAENSWLRLRPHVADWIAKNHISLLVFRVPDPNYEAMIREEPAWFAHVGTYWGGHIEVYDVHGPS